MTSRIIQALISEDLQHPASHDRLDALRYYRHIVQSGLVKPVPLSHEPPAGLCLHYFCGHFLSDNRARDSISAKTVHAHFTALHPVAVQDARWALPSFARELEGYLTIIGRHQAPTGKFSSGVESFSGVTVALTPDRARYAENIALFGWCDGRRDHHKTYEIPRNERSR